MSTFLRYTARLRFIITATVVGNTLEWLDFALFGLLAPLFAQLFFPPDPSPKGISHPLFFIALAGFARPIGGFIFGYLGDRSGRKSTLIKTIVLMTIPATLISVLPTYDQIGLMATVLLGMICIFQGFCTAGEFPGSIVFLTESAPPRLRGYAGSWAYFGAILGMFLGVLDLFFIRSQIPEADFNEWGWRIPFFIGTLLGVGGFLLRRVLHETPLFEKEKAEGLTLKRPIFTLFKNYKQLLVKGFGIFIFDAVGFNVVVIFSTTYFTQVLKMTTIEAFAINTFTILILLIVLPISGRLTLRLGCVRLAKWALCAMIISAYPLYLFMDALSIWSVLITQMCFAIFLGCYLGTLPEIVASLFPTQVRYSATAMVVNFSVALFGGTAPFIAIYLVEWTAMPTIPSLYLIGGALISLISLFTVKDQKFYTR